MSDPCAGHECDHCPRCDKGRCCRSDNARYTLPAEGSWQPVNGEVGVRNTDGDRMECHACGGWYRTVAGHAWQAHDLTADEYRALFGLSNRGLVGESLAVSQSERMKRRIDDGSLILPRNRVTPEQHAAARTSAETRRGRVVTAARMGPASRTPDVIEKIRTTRRRNATVMAQCVVCGSEFEVLRYRLTKTCGREQCLRSRLSESTPEKRATAQANIARATEVQRDLWQDPEWRARLLEARRPASEARKNRVTKPCSECGSPFEVIPSHADKVWTCSPSCSSKRRSRAQTGRSQTPEARARIAAAKREWWASRAHKAEIKSDISPQRA